MPVLLWLALLLTPSASRAQLVNDGATITLSNITNSFTGNVTVGTNGSFTLLVLSDNALLTNSANGNIGLNVTAKSNAVQLISPTARWRMGGTLFVGSNGSLSRLVVSNGAFVESASLTVGNHSAGSNNEAIVTGPGSTLNSPSGIWVGAGGNSNRLTILNGGQIIATNSVGLSVVGFNEGVKATSVLVSDPGSRWSVNHTLFIGSGGNDNMLVVSNGALVDNVNGTIGGGIVSASNNLVLVTGAGTTWSNRGFLRVGDVGPGSQLIVSNGGSLFVGESAYVGFSSLSAGNRVTVAGAGSVYSNANLFYLGFTGARNQLIVSNGATMSVGGPGVLGQNSGANSNSAVVAGPGTSWRLGSDLCVGSNGAFNLLIVSNGALVENAAFQSGAGAASVSNTVLVTDTGSVWSNRLALNVGLDGSGNQLVVSNGAAVYGGLNAVIGTAGSAVSNTVALTDSGTRLVVVSNLLVGSDGSFNKLTVANGAQLENGSGVIGARISCNRNEVLVSGIGSMWTNWSSIYVGSNGAFNRLVVSNGGQLRSVGGFIGEYIGFFGPTNADNNEAIITGAGSLWQSVGLFVGNWRNTGNRLVVSNGASMFNGHCYIGFQATNSLVLVTGPGSTWSNRAFVALGQGGAGNKLLIANSASASATFIEVGYGAKANNNLLQLDDGELRTDPNVSAGRLHVFSGNIRFNSGLMDLGLLLLTNAQGTFEFNGGTLLTRGAAINNGTRFVVGANGATPAIWDVRATVTNTFVGGDLYVGSNVSSCQLILTNGALLTNASSAFLGWEAGAKSNRVTLAGAGSRWMLDDGLNLGEFGAFNRLVVSNGAALVTGASSAIGLNFSSSNNEAVVTGPGSSWTSGLGQLFVGDLGRNNRLLVSDGGQVVSYVGRIGDFVSDASNNLAMVTGAGSTWSNATDLYVGNAGARNTLVVSNSGAVFAGNAIYVGFANSSINNRVIVDGGTLSATNGTGTGLLDVRRGFFTLNSGLVDVDRLLGTNSAVTFQFNGGVVSARNSSFAIAPDVGNYGPVPATYFLAGNGVHDLPGLVVRAGSTLAGNGTINGIIVTDAVLPLGVISPGASIGKIVLNSSPILNGLAFMEISKNGSTLTNDQIQVNAPLQYRGTLTVTNIGTTALASEDTFKLFSATSYSGAFATITLPPLAPGLHWKNRLLVDGTIVVDGSPIPKFSGITWSGTNLIVTGTNGLPNAPYDVLTSTNVAWPLTNWFSLLTNQFNASGAFSFTNPIAPGEPQRYFQIRTSETPF